MDTNPLVITTGEECAPLRAMIPNPTVAWFPDGGSPRHLIVASLPGITRQEMAEFAGPMRFDLCLYHELVVLMMTPKGRPQPIEMVWAALESEPPITPDQTPGHRLVGLVVMDHDSGVVLKQRLFTWAPHFDRAVEQQFARQQVAPATEAQVMRRVVQMRFDYPTSKKMLRRSVAHCQTGS